MGNHTAKQNIDLLEPLKSCFGEDERGNWFIITLDEIKAVCAPVKKEDLVELRVKICLIVLYLVCVRSTREETHRYKLHIFP